MDIKINGEIQVKDFFNEIVIIDGEHAIKMLVPQAKKLFEQLEDTLFDESESHEYLQNKLYRVERQNEELETDRDYWKTAYERRCC